jgi:inosose dehydratase
VNGYRLASAPVTWGVWERTTGRDDLIPPEELLAAVAGLGYTGIELGPPGYFGSDGAEAAAALEAHGLDLVGGFAPLRFEDPEGFAEDVAVWLDPIVDALEATGARGPVVLAGAETPERVAAAGRPDEQARAALDADTFARAMERVNEAADRCLARGVGAAFHHHTATPIETPAEIAGLLESTDVDICFDTGHALVGGGDPVEVARMCGARITHLHLKDVDGARLARVRDGDVDLDQAWADGIFCPFGDGVVDFDAVLALPELQAFAGWVVLEQDRVAVRRSDLPAVRAIEQGNLEVVVAALGGLTAQ